METILEVPLTRGLIALIDAVDAPTILSHRWQARPHFGTFYAQSTFRDGRKRTVQMHRLIMAAPPDLDVDHRNHNGLDNRHRNLRLCTASQNQGNVATRRDNSSGYRGVSWWHRTRRWRAYIYIDGRQHCLGHYVDPWEAAQAYNSAALAKWGEFALLNIPSPRCGDRY